MARQRNRIRITGIVQGVGFRPTVYTYARAFNLTGTVCNNVEGVTVEVEGPPEAVHGFIDRLRTSPPPLSSIASFEVTAVAPLGDDDFTILRSDDTGLSKEAAISPDLATCADCRREILDPTDRRFGYPFTNCTNCGPRFTIIRDRPYDRHLTSMGAFPMCPQCAAEYEDPLNRRFHAQPNACPDCGPSLTLLDGTATGAAALAACIRGIANGEIWAVKGLGGFNLALDPTIPGALERIRTLKRRPCKAFALMARDLDVARRFCDVSEAEELLLMGPAAPIVLLKKRNAALDAVSPDNNRLGIMLPYTPLHHLLLAPFEVLVMTSANLRDEPLAATDDEILALMSQGLCDNVLTHDRAIVHRCDDSIAQIVEGRTHWLRRARGQVPVTLSPTLPNGRQLPDSLAYGANLKNCFALSKGGRITLSQHIGDLMDVRNLDWQRSQIEDLAGLLEVTPVRLVTDAHPGYENATPQLPALSPDVPVHRVFHHHAHILSVLAEHDALDSPVLGISCDGTGYGPDGTIWGCEFLQVLPTCPEARRAAHLATFPLPGGEQAIHETDRIAMALARTAGIAPSRLPFPPDRMKAMEFLMDRGINSPLTSSAGRLFDGVSALLGICLESGYEGRAAIMLQQAAEQSGPVDGSYPVVIEGDAPRVIRFEPMISALLDDRDPVEKRALRFHQWFVESLLTVVVRERPLKVAASGGVFQNSLLLSALRRSLDREGIPLLVNERFPVNDGGIALGQIVHPGPGEPDHHQKKA